MTTAQRLALWSASAVAGASGLAYAAMKYLLPRNDPFSAYGHPLQPHALKIHVLAVPILVFVVGWLYGAHAQHQLRNGEGAGRASGRAILALTFVLVLSGTLVQAFADARWRPAAAWIHGVTGTAFVASLAAHAWAGRRRRAAVEAPATPSTPAPRRPAYLRPIAFPRPAAGSPASPGRRGDAPAAAHGEPRHGLDAGGCGACRGCGIALATGTPGPAVPGPERAHPRANRD